ncbi:glycosyltransferase family 4 protein [Halomicroarcula sp. S1AR25-4]|uniref:glycosyltransferase family 4 protein n=1 Tax=Haloarcula sp. S1AR25-4 TaxID=2950538 RepID=UPI0028746B75|nr:glycosyltransferase family 4 protein [Halomicroarcula sp. S1AR25-4]MDS0277672.1 glycosyltransferase family 4 protein [Halomicroarcula sp. S1AR25-4]
MSDEPISRSDPDATYRVLGCATEHPNHVFQVRTPFNHRSFDALNATGVDLDVVSPTPVAPPVGPYSEYRHVPKTEQWGSYRVHYPRYLYMLPKRYFYHVSGNSVQKRVTKYVERTFETPHDVVQACGFYLDGYATLEYCKRHDIPLVALSHAGDLKNFDRFNDAVQSHIRETIDYCSAVLTVSDELSAVARRFAPASKVTTLPIGEDPENYPTERRDAIRRELGVAPETKLLLFVGRFEKEKGVRDLVAALESLDRDDVAVAAVGHGGALRWWFLDRLGELRHPAHAYWQLDPIAVRRLHVAADLLVHPSHFEARPTVIYEAMAAETPVLASNVGGIPEMVVDGETGVLVPPHDPAALAETLDYLLDDPERLREMGRAGLQRLLDQQWTWQRHAERLNEVHREVVRA